MKVTRCYTRTTPDTGRLLILWLLPHCQQDTMNRVTGRQGCSFVLPPSFGESMDTFGFDFYGINIPQDYNPCPLVVLNPYKEIYRWNKIYHSSSPLSQLLCHSLLPKGHPPSLHLLATILYPWILVSTPSAYKTQAGDSFMARQSDAIFVN